MGASTTDLRHVRDEHDGARLGRGADEREGRLADVRRRREARRAEQRHEALRPTRAAERGREVAAERADH